MTKYFYTNSLDAFYMEQKWGVKYKLECLNVDAYVTTVDSVIPLGNKPPAVSAFVIEPDEPDEKWVVHEDSVHLFEPQVGDMVIDLSYTEKAKLIALTITPTTEESLSTPVRYYCGSGNPLNYYCDSKVKIVQRNNTAFITPEVEHDVI